MASILRACAMSSDGFQWLAETTALITLIWHYYSIVKTRVFCTSVAVDLSGCHQPHDCRSPRWRGLVAQPLRASRLTACGSSTRLWMVLSYPLSCQKISPTPRPLLFVSESYKDTPSCQHERWMRGDFLGACRSSWEFSRASSFHLLSYINQ
jgi:hypothetical protein